MPDFHESFDVSRLDATSVGELCSALAAGSRTVTRFELQEEGRRLHVEAADEHALRYVDELVKRTRASSRRMRRKVLYRWKAEPRYRGDIDAALAASGDYYALDAGLVGLRGVLLGLCRFFEKEFESLARTYAAEENRYPTLVPVQLLEELGYFGHFPNQVTFCGHLPEDLPYLDRVVRECRGAGGRLPADALDSLVAPRVALKPAVCLPCYRQRRGCVVSERTPEAVSMQNHVFRYEGSRFQSLARLWEFSVRDLVFFGQGDRVAERREEVMEWAMALCRELDLDATIQLANDPFFLDQTRDMLVYQRMGEVKYELTLSLPFVDGGLAASSFNLHRAFYTEIYDVRTSSGERAESACMGFGIERWVYAFLAQKGLSPDGWPRRVAVCAENG
jgi:hypothetical protein